MVAIPLEVSVQVESSVEDAMMVSYARPDGTVFRGALLKVKEWPSPSVLPVAVSSMDSAGEVEEASLVAVAPADSTCAPPPPPSLVTPAMADYAALQHRWSYFLKNIPPLPKKNLPSRRERERLDQVPKLRPRNFLCTRCKYALPGFTQPQATLCPSGNTSSVELIPSISATSSPVTGLNGHAMEISSQSHIRKRKVPFKRPILTRPLVETCSVTDDSLGQGSGNVSGEACPPGQPTQQLSSTTSRNYGKQSSHRMEEKSSVPAMATILSAGDNSLKMKFKLNSSAVQPPEVLPASKRARTAKLSTVYTTSDIPNSLSDDDDDDRPRLKIVEDGEARNESEPKSNEALLPPSVALPPPLPVVEEVATPMKTPARQRTKRLAEGTARNTGQVEASAAKLETAKAFVANKSSKLVAPRVYKEKQDSSKLNGQERGGGGMPKPVARAVTRCTTKDNRHFAIKDVVWGKITGYPWWPGVIRHIVVCDDPLLQKTAVTPAFSDPQAALPILQYQEAQVEWFGQKSSISYIEVNQLAHFNEDFGRKHKPKLRGSYQEAIKLAKQTAKDARIDRDGIHGICEQYVEEKDVLSQIVSETRHNRRRDNERQFTTGSESSVQSLEPFVDSSQVATSTDDYEFI